MTNSLPEGGGESITFLGDFSKKLAANTLFTFVGRFWAFFALILLTPYILRHLSKEEFGVWIILNVLISSFTLLDFGLGSAFVKFISAYEAHGDYDNINRVLFSGLLFYLLLALLIVAGGLSARDVLFRWFGISGVFVPYLLALITCAVGNIASMFLSVFRGIQRMDKSTAIEVGMSILNVVGTVVVLQSGFKLTGLSVNALVMACITLVASGWAVRRAIPRISSGSRFDWNLLREMFQYGVRIVVSRISGVVCFQLPNLIVGKFIGVASIPFYEVSARLAASMRAIPLLMMSALIPATSELSARDEKEKIARTYMIASKYVAIVTAGLCGFVVLEADALLKLWLGPGFGQSVILVQVLAIGYGANVLGGPASQTGAGIGRPEFDMRSTLLLTIVSPIAGVLLVRNYGIAGAAAGTALALILAAAYLVFTFHRNYLETPVVRMFSAIHVRPVAASALGVASVAAFHYVVPADAWLDYGRHLVSATLLLDALVFATVYIGLLVAFRQVTAIDWRNFLSLVTFGFEFIRHPFRERVKIYR